MPYTARPNYRAGSHVVAAGHYLAAMAGHDLLREGGNAIDAAAAIAFCLSVLEPHQNGLGGECPTLVHVGGVTFAVSGQGFSPASLTMDWFRREGLTLIPGDGLLPATVPSAVGTWLLLLREFGTRPLARILEPAIDLAEDGFAVHESLVNAITASAERFESEWPTSAAVYLIDGRPPRAGEIVKLPALADTMRRLRNESGRKMDRLQGLQAANDWFYKGAAASAIGRFCASSTVRDCSGREYPGFLTADDIASWRPRLEDPVTHTYRQIDVYKCGPWTQGPVFLQQLAILEGFDLRRMGWGTVDYLHTLMEAAKLAFADREAYYGDPDFDDVPLGALLSESYNRRRRGLIDPLEASADLRPGDPAGGRVPDVRIAAAPGNISGPEAGAAHVDPAAFLTGKGDTTHFDVVDRWGNCVSATPSGGWLQSSPVIPDLGFPLGTRGQMFYLSEGRANSYEPRKRPRATLTPSLAFKDGRPWMVFGTPGGDGQDQWTLQAFLNVVEFGMSPAEAVEAPTVTSHAFPSSFYPRASHPRLVSCESRIPADVMRGLQDRGHEIDVAPALSHGKPSMIVIGEGARLEAAITSRAEIGYVAGW